MKDYHKVTKEDLVNWQGISLKNRYVCEKILPREEKFFSQEFSILERITFVVNTKICVENGWAGYSEISGNPGENFNIYKTREAV